jgi:hypothetical protein
VCRSVPHAALPASHSAGTAGDQCLYPCGHRQLVDPRAEQGLPSPVVDYIDGRVVASMVSSGPSLNMEFDDRDSPIYATRGSCALGSFRVYPTWLGGGKAYAVGADGAKGLFPGTGEAF